MSGLSPQLLGQLSSRFAGPAVRAIILMGSEARGDAGPDSDVDLVRLVTGDAPPLPDSGSHLMDGRLVVVSDAGPTETEAWFTRPERAVQVIAGVRSARALFDPEGAFAALQRRASAFVWDAAVQHQADRWASREMTGWAEEALKGVEGLRRGDTGRLLNARHLAWGLTRVLTVQLGVLLNGDNSFYAQTEQALGRDSAWAQTRRKAFAIEDSTGVTPTLEEQVAAALRLYVLTATLLAPILRVEDLPVVEHTVARIGAALGSRRTQGHPTSRPG